MIQVVGDILGHHYYHHATLETLFMEAGAPGDVPHGSCVLKCQRWLKLCNEEPSVDPFHVLGGVLENLMEIDVAPSPFSSESSGVGEHQDRVRRILGKYGLTYHLGGHIVGGGAGAPTRSLKQALESQDLAAVEVEFNRCIANAEQDPPAAVTAACAGLEALFKAHIEDCGLELPKKQSLKPLWQVVSKDLGLDPGGVGDADLMRILSGLTSVVDGVASIRTHEGSAHGRGRANYRLSGRHARLVIHAAHSLAVFVIETSRARVGNDANS
ncbi:MAG: abortive infection family protein [Planctomycetota bacterium]